MEYFLSQEKSHFEHWSGNISNLGENVAHAQPSVSQEKRRLKIPNLTMSQANVQVKILKRMIENQQQRELKRSQKMRISDGLRKSRQRNPFQSHGQIKTTKKYSESIFLLENTVKSVMM